MVLVVEWCSDIIADKEITETNLKLVLTDMLADIVLKKDDFYNPFHVIITEYSFKISFRPMRANMHLLKKPPEDKHLHIQYAPECLGPLIHTDCSFCASSGVAVERRPPRPLRPPHAAFSAVYTYATACVIRLASENAAWGLNYYTVESCWDLKLISEHSFIVSSQVM